MSEHKWLSEWPGNYCLKCGMEDPAEICITSCYEAPLDQHGIPDFMRCPIHNNPNFMECPVEDKK